VDSIHLVHLLSVAAWGGLVIAEVVVELVSHRGESRRHAATLHYWMDLVGEAPLLLAVVTSGALLTWRHWPLTTLHTVKITLAGVAISANLVCMRWVVLRHRAADAELGVYRRHILWTGLGLPFGMAAMGLGLYLVYR
jgi:hypothetical protein